MRFFHTIYLSLLIAHLSSCSPLRSSSREEKHQLELTLQEIQTSIDDLHHDFNCFQTELQILESRIKYSENAVSLLKQQDLESQKKQLNTVTEQVSIVEEKIRAFVEVTTKEHENLKQLTNHANETTAALTQFKDRFSELEEDLHARDPQLEEIGRIKALLESITTHLHSIGEGKVYRVKPGDSLEKIARLHKTTVEQIKKINGLDQDLIIVGQELRISSLEQ